MAQFEAVTLMFGNTSRRRVFVSQDGSVRPVAKGFASAMEGDTVRTIVWSRDGVTASIAQVGMGVINMDVWQEVTVEEVLNGLPRQWQDFLRGAADAP